MQHATEVTFTLSCGEYDWSKTVYENAYSGLKMGVNSFTHNITWKMPESKLE
jgi:hypothetical protein